MAGERPPYLIRACAACKEKKLRCLMSDGPPWACKRCLQKKLKCVVPESRPRQRKKIVHELRIAQLERNVDRVISLLPNASRQCSSLTTSADTGTPQDFVTATGSPEQSLVDGIDSIVSAQQADLLVADYREQFAKSFPYVVLPENATFYSLRDTSPMFLLAILITTSWKDGARLDALNQHFLKMLGIKLIQNGDRELDLLCGLLVYLNWIHLHMAPKTHQAYRLTSIAISMAVDYGITRRPGKGRHQQLNVETANDLPRGLTIVDTEFWGLEAQRAYLGCYHIATWYSIITRKVIPLAYTEYLHLCAQSLVAAHEVPSDSDLIFHLELTREAEKVYTLFNYTETSQAQSMNDEQIQIYLNAFCAKLEDWRSRLPTSLKDDREHGQQSQSGVPTPLRQLLTTSLASQKVWPSLFEAFVREVSLSGMSRSTDMSVFRIRIIMDSLRSTKEFLDTFLLIPLVKLISLPSTHWALLGYSILLAATMSLSIQTPGWNTKMARSIIKLDAYIDALSVHVHELSSRIEVLETAKDWYKSLLTRWAAIKSSYLATLQQAQPETNTPVAAVASTSAPESQLVQYPAEQRMDMQQDPQSPAPADIRHEARPLPMGDSFLNSSGGLELFDFTASVGSWMVPDFDFPWLGVAGF